MFEQNYEKYWKLTLEYTNINSDKFIGTLKIIVKCINEAFNYEQLQNEVNKYYPKVDMGSVRKSINQFVKLGFINSLTSYNIETLDFLRATTSKRRQSIFSKIIYKYSKFNASITNTHNWNQINFLIKTLEEVGKLSKKNIIGLMLVDMSSISRGFLTKKEVNKYTTLAKNQGFIDRKYNQVSYLFNLLKKLDDIVFVDNTLYFKDDAKIIFGEDLKQETKKRDGYLHRIYKNQLKEEVEDKLSYTQCMLEKLSYPSLVASHIKPFIDSDDNEAYDPNNGLLLSRNMDILFDQGYISFNDDGTIIYSYALNKDVVQYLQNYQLDSIFINQNRKYYLDYHRSNILRKNI